MKKGKIVSFLSALVLLATVAVFSVACAAERERRNNIEVGGMIYIDGEQTIYVSGVTSVMGDAPAVFHSDITAADITLGGAVAGKTIESVSFVSSEEIRIVLSGKVTSFEGDGALGEVTVSARALEGNEDSYGMVRVYTPKLSTVFGSVTGSTTKQKCRSLFSLPYGSFTDDATAENIALVDPTNGVLSEVALIEGELRVTVENYDPTKGEKYPLVRIPANATTFNVEIEVHVGMTLSSYPLT